MKNGTMKGDNTRLIILKTKLKGTVTKDHDKNVPKEIHQESG